MAVAIRPVMISFILRTAALWLGTRIVFTVFIRAAARQLPAALAPPPGLTHPLSIAPATAIVLAATVAALVLNDVRVMRERAFLANIGVGLRTIGSFAFAGAISLEIAVALLLVVVQ